MYKSVSLWYLQQAYNVLWSNLSPVEIFVQLAYNIISHNSQKVACVHKQMNETKEKSGTHKNETFLALKRMGVFSLLLKCGWTLMTL